MTLIEALILGVIQGITEFLPISSSGHLVLSQSILNIEQPGNELEILLHLGTLGSIFVVFFHDIKFILFSLKSKKTRLFFYCIIIGTLPSIIIALRLKDYLEPLFENVLAVGISLVFTGIVLYGSNFIKKREKEISYFKSIIIGIAQAVAIIPGISRSGMTITGSLLLGLSPREAARFSFLLAIPAICGAGFLTMMDSNNGFHIKIQVAIIGFFSSFIVGVVALRWLMKTLERGSFHYFGIYCVCLGFLTIIFFEWI